MKILVCGDRNYTDKAKIKKCLEIAIKKFKLNFNEEKHYIIHGCAYGADRLSGIVGKELGFNIIEFPADWNKYGKSAGPIRNQQMLIEGKPDFVMAFHPDITNSKGTKHMIFITKQNNIPFKIFT